MGKDIKVIKFPGNILYIENIFLLHKEFLEAIENFDADESIHGIIPQWSKWADDTNREWVPVKTKYEASKQALLSGISRITKLVDWDITINEDNTLWPKVEVDSNYSDAHRLAYDILRMIDEPYKDSLGIWADTFNQTKPVHISKNYCIRKYKTGADMVAHIDKNLDRPTESMDWTGLIYLNDNYEGGEIVFPELNVSFKPSAGSIVFFPCETVHKVNQIITGNKTYIFTFIHTKYEMTTCLGEPYEEMTDKINYMNGWTY